MTDIPNESPVPEREASRRWVWDWPAVAGIAFGLLFFLGFALGSPESPDSDAPLEEWVDWATDSANGRNALMGIYFWVLAALAFVVFVGGLARRIRIARGRGSLAAVHVYGVGLLTAALLAASAVVINTGPIVYLMDGEGQGDIPDPTSTAFFEQIASVGYLLLTVAMALALAALVAMTSAALRDSMPQWFTILSYAAAVILVASIMFVPIMLIPIWPLAAGILLLRRPVTAEQSRT
jgi:hypothetical protein